MRTGWALTVFQGGCTCQGGVPARGCVPARGVYLPGGCTCQGVYLPEEGCTCQMGGVPARGGCTCQGVYLPEGGVPARGGCTCLGGVPVRGGVYLTGGGYTWSGTPNPPSPVNRMTDRCKNITLAKTSFRPVKIFSGLVSPCLNNPESIIIIFQRTQGCPTPKWSSIR